MKDQGPCVVIVDSDLNKARQIASFVKFLGYAACAATDHVTLAERIAESSAVLAIFVVSDSGFKLLASSRQVSAEKLPGCPLFLIDGAYTDSKLPPAIQSRLQGTISGNPSYRELLGTLQQAALLYRYRNGAESDSHVELYRNLIGSSADIESVRQLVRQVAATDASVLIGGESGTGKEVVARCVHSLSPRREKPFVPINCGAVPAELLESELFGHEKGAFTGAISARKGRFEMAEGGTLFLDEIGDMPLDMQVKLLRVIQERTFERVGSDRTIHANVRIVAASHRNLEQLVAEGTFRMDLFYRLNVFPIEISPLRDRVSDIPLLIEAYVNKLEREQRGILRLSECAVASLARYFWPGNVRELFNLLERLAILHPQKMVKWSDLPDKFRPNQELFVEQEQSEASVDWHSELRLPADGIDLRPHLAGIERSLMTQALMQSEWVVARAAKLLNLQRTTLVEKMRKFEIHKPKEMTGF